MHRVTLPWLTVPRQDNLLQTLTLLNFKVLFPKLMLSAWLIYIFITKKQLLPLSSFTCKQMFCYIWVYSVTAARISEAVEAGEADGKFQFSQILIQKRRFSSMSSSLIPKQWPHSFKVMCLSLLGSHSSKKRVMQCSMGTREARRGASSECVKILSAGC